MRNVINREELKALSKGSWSYPMYATCDDINELDTRLKAIEGTSSTDHTCIGTEKIVFPETQTADYCHTITTICEDCGKELSISTTVPHDFQLEGSSPIFGDTYTCAHCGYSYVEPVS